MLISFALTLELSTSLAKLGGMEFLVNDAPAGRHPLNISGLDDALIADRIGMLDLPVEGNGDGLEAAVRMLTDSLGRTGVGGEGLGSGIVEHKKR